MRVGPRPVLVVAAAAAFGLAQSTWWQVDWTSSLSGEGGMGLSGSVATSGLAQLLPLAVGGGLLLTLTVRSAGRRVVAVVSALLFAGMAALGLAHPAPRDAIVADALSASLASEWTLTMTALPWLYGAVGLVGVAGSVLFALRPGTRGGSAAHSGSVEVADSLASWKAMDEGHDPTDDGGRA